MNTFKHHCAASVLPYWDPAGGPLQGWLYYVCTILVHNTFAQYFEPQSLNDYNSLCKGVCHYTASDLPYWDPTAGPVSVS